MELLLSSLYVLLAHVFVVTFVLRFGYGGVVLTCLDGNKTVFVPFKQAQVSVRFNRNHCHKRERKNTMFMALQ